jgi:hypothetical protein
MLVNATLTPGRVAAKAAPISLSTVNCCSLLVQTVMFNVVGSAAAVAAVPGAASLAALVAELAELAALSLAVGLAGAPQLASNTAIPHNHTNHERVPRDPRGRDSIVGLLFLRRIFLARCD